MKHLRLLPPGWSRTEAATARRLLRLSEEEELRKAAEEKATRAEAELVRLLAEIERLRGS